MKIVNTKHWAIPPIRETLFRIQNDLYKCHLVLFGFALISYVRSLS